MRAQGMWNRNLILLLTGRMVSDLGSSIQMMIMPLVLIDMGGTATVIGLFSFFYLVPMLFIYPFAGVIGDRLNRKKIMVSADLFSALIALALAGLAYSGRLGIPSLLGLQVMLGMMYGFFDPATKGMIPELVTRENLGQVNSLVATLRILSGLLAPLIAVAIYVRFGVGILFLANGISFLLSAISESFIVYRFKRREEGISRSSVLRDLKTGMAYIFGNRLIRNMSLYFLVVFTMIQPIFAVALPLLFRTKLVYPDGYYGLMQSVLLTGALVGSLGVGMASRRVRLQSILVVGSSTMALSMLVLGVIALPAVLLVLGNSGSGYYVLLCATLFLLYSSIMMITIPVQTIIQQQTDESFMSRVFSLVGLISKSGMPLGALIYGLMLDLFEIHIVMLGGGILVLLTVVFFVSVMKESGDMRNRA